ncbi:YesK family protein [Peribacillus simplex]|uniref:YesK family protein n=2 Tax=Peribacillus TaxID=2675229 RepID=A0AA90PDH8_9BACI|nr:MULTISPECIES: YesK family protein [Peribacillus]MDP1419544.1 YesK family protein [Peribacillus simplex]MDP1452511.1 YesK family protein [Peribacillus frigoritolerans]
MCPWNVSNILAWSFRKLHLSLFVKLLPSILTVIASFILFYMGFVNIKGFEGAGYGILAFFLLPFAIVASIIASKNKGVQS